MTLIFAQSESVFLMSPWKPVIVFLVLIAWAWVISHLDKDAAYYYLPRYWWNLGQMACGLIGFGLILLIPYFFVGLILGLIVLAGGILGYAYFRNQHVPEEAHWTLSLDSFSKKLENYQHGQAQKRATLTFLLKDETRMDVPSGDDPRGEAHSAFENVVDFAVPRGADQIQINVDSQRAVMAARIDGVQYPQPELEPKSALALIDYLKDLAGLDVADRRKRQRGSLRFDAGELGHHTLEIETAGSTRGLTMLMDLDKRQRQQMPLTHLGLLDSQKAQLAQVLEQRGRVVLVTSPARQGLTTTIYSLLQEHDPYVSNVVTLEDGVQLELEGVSHNDMSSLTPQQFNEKLASIIRTDPSVLMLDHLADAETVPLVANSSEEIRYYIAMPENDTFAALVRWVKLLGDRKQAAESLAAITSQRLVRKLCMTCRMPYKPDPAALRKLNLPVDRVGQLYHASGKVMEKEQAVPCPDCMGLGYKGRIGVFELMVLDDTARSLVAAGDLDRLRSHLRKQKMLWLQEAGLAKVVEGVTDVKEITRTLGGVSKGPAKPAESAA